MYFGQKSYYREMFLFSQKSGGWWSYYFQRALYHSEIRVQPKKVMRTRATLIIVICGPLGAMGGLPTVSGSGGGGLILPAES